MQPVVLWENTGIPVGGPMSAQLASLTLMHREVVQPLPWGLQQALWIRSRDNFLFMLKLTGHRIAVYLRVPNVRVHSHGKHIEVDSWVQLTGVYLQVTRKLFVGLIYWS